MPPSFHLPVPLPPTHVHLSNSNWEELRLRGEGAARAWVAVSSASAAEGPTVSYEGMVGIRERVLWHGGSYGVPVFMVLAVQAHQGLESQQEAR